MYLCKLNSVQEFSYNSPTHRVPLNCQMFWTNSHAGSFLPLDRNPFVWVGSYSLSSFLSPSFSSDFAEPLTLPSMIDPGPSTSDSPMGATPLGSSPPEESIAILTSMGFPRNHSIQALKATVSLLPTLFMFALCVLIHFFFFFFFIDQLATTLLFQAYFLSLLMCFLPADDSNES